MNSIQINSNTSTSTTTPTSTDNPSTSTTPVLRLRGGGLKKRCSAYIAPTDRCSQVSLRLIGDCSYCEASYCGRHRLPEDHSCTGLESCRQAAFQKNKNKLESESVSSRKIEAM